MPYILLIVASLCFSMQASALELQLDEHIHDKSIAVQPAMATQPSTAQTDIEVQSTPAASSPSHFQWW